MITPSKGRAQSVNILAPVGGWNARDPLSQMPATDAVALDNWWPMTGELRVRDGNAAHGTGISGRVESLMPYASPTANKLFGVAGGNVYDVTASGAVGAAATTFSNSRIQHEIFTTAAGTYLYCVNGVDAPQHYNGSVWAAPAITGVTASSFVHVCAHKSRLWFVQINSMSAWYLSVNSVAGAATELNLGGIFTEGGYLVAMGTWTLDAGRGVDDHAVFVTSKGEVAVYAGTDPTSASDWALVGVYKIGAPIGRRCMEKFGGDLLIICVDGVYPLSAALQSTRIEASQAITDKIRTAVTEATNSYGTLYGWKIMQHPDKNALLLNVPISATVSHQYVMNALTGAWARFTGWNAYCFAIHDGDLYFGGTNTVYKAWTGRSDNGRNIIADAKPAFTDFGVPAQKKHFQMVKPYIRTNGPVAPSYLLNIDYGDKTPTTTPTTTPINASLWGTAIWGTSLWSGGLTLFNKWAKVNGVGYCASLRMRVATNTNEIRWYSTDYLVETGGIL